MKDIVLRRGSHSGTRCMNRRKCRSDTVIGRPCMSKLSHLCSRLRGMKIGSFRSESS